MTAIPRILPLKIFEEMLRKRLRLFIILCLLLIFIMYFTNRRKKAGPDDFPTLKTQRAYIAAMFYNNEDILPGWIENLLEIIPHFSSVYISIHENGSGDGTKDMLLQLSQTLDQLKIPYNITTSSKPKAYGNRIFYLSQLRNDAIYNFYENEQQQTFDKLIFFNDIRYDQVDFLRMVEAKEIDGKYDAICGLDYMNLFYDEFATREDLVSREPFGGVRPHKFPPHFYDRTRQDLVRRGRLTPVYSCWNGVAVFSVRPFYQLKLQFRGLSLAYSHNYAASECCLIHADMQRHGFNRVYVDPRFVPRYGKLHWDDHLVNVLCYFFKWIHFPRPSPKMVEELKQIRKTAKEDQLDDFDVTCIQQR